MSPHNTETEVLIIGGGAAGLSTAAALAKRGIRSTILEKDDHIGGSWTRRYQTLKLHTIRQFSGLAHYPIPNNFPRYLSKDQYANYLVEYAQKQGLNISFGESVHTVQQNSQSSNKVEWNVETNQGIWKTKILVIATGQHAEACIPTWECLDRFTGTVLHSSQYKSGAAFSGKKVLVVGLGNSGAEIAADLVTNGASHVSISVRTTPPIVSREMFGVVPVQLLGIALMPMGIPQVIDRINTMIRRISIGDLTRCGLNKAEWGPFSARRPAVIDTGFVKQLKQTNILVRPEIARFDSEGVIYKDGSKETLDVVISATGFRTGLEKILKVPDAIGGNGKPRFSSGRPTSSSGLYFIGFDETVRGQLFEINRESKQLAAEIDGYLQRCIHA